MSYKERLALEENNTNQIFLFNDGPLFYALLERSAYVFHTRIKPFKVQVKTLKSVDHPFVSIGVPADKVNNYLEGMTVEKDDHGIICAKLDEPINEMAFKAWKNHILEQKQLTQANEKYIPDINNIFIPNNAYSDIAVAMDCLKEIQTLNIASMTPMETMLYLNNLQEKLKKIKL